MNLVSLESLLNPLLDNAKISIFFKSRQDVPFVVLGHIYYPENNPEKNPLFEKANVKKRELGHHGFRILYLVIIISES